MANDCSKMDIKSPTIVKLFTCFFMCVFLEGGLYQRKMAQDAEVGVEAESLNKELTSEDEFETYEDGAAEEDDEEEEEDDDDPRVVPHSSSPTSSPSRPPRPPLPPPPPSFRMQQQHTVVPSVAHLGFPRAPPGLAKPRNPPPVPQAVTNSTAAGGGKSTRGNNSNLRRKKAGAVDSSHNPPNENLIINYIPTSMVTGQLWNLFSPYGEIVSSNVVRDPTTGDSLGYGFVKFSTIDEATAALNALNGTEVDGKKIKVSFSLPRNNTSNATSYRYGGNDGYLNQPQQQQPRNNLYISGLPIFYTEDDVKQLFSEFEPVHEANILYDQQGQSRGVAFVKLDSHQLCLNAIDKLNSSVPPRSTSRIVVKFAATKEQKPSSSKALYHGGRQQIPLFPQGGSYGPITQANRSGLRGRRDPLGGGPKHHSKRGQMMAPPPPQLMQFPYMPMAGIPGPYPMFMIPPGATFAPFPAGAAMLHGNPPMPVAGFPMSAPSPPTGVPHSSSQANPSSNSAGVTQGYSGVCLFLFHLPLDISEATLLTLFSSYGTVTNVKIPRDSATQRTKGYGFVNLSTMQEAQNAMSALNGYPIGNKRLKVSLKNDSSASSS
eukprot:TRINITY_DN1091_c0_g2_i1.p1 TRINITY_DN1091_c0_g2~~TRINITY_DN1091_c0_g2_i1.p1  ORF type:complete len:602 (-),score=150.42 TRINITY_DN1091_c0_g2_i1:1156-2961(-)